jgi:hypothetical protein
MRVGVGTARRQRGMTTEGVQAHDFAILTLIFLVSGSKMSGVTTVVSGIYQEQTNVRQLIIGYLKQDITTWLTMWSAEGLWDYPLVC